MADKNRNKIKLINGLAILMGLCQALLIYVASSYFEQLSGQQNVGIFYFIAYLVVFIALLNFHKLVKFFGKSIVLQLSMIAEIVMIVSLIFSNSVWLSIAALVGYLIFESMVNVSMDIMLETFSRDLSSGRIRGNYISVFYLGFIFGPFLSAFLLGKYGFIGIFILLVIIKLIIFAVSFWGLGNVNHDYSGRNTIAEVFKKVNRHKNIKRIYFISFALEFFYAMMVIYSPIYLRGLGIGWVDISHIFMVMLTPFLFFEYPLGWLADKKWGEKKMIIFFLVWLAISTVFVTSVLSSKIWVWMVILLLTRIGAASIQILRDSYFYKRIDGKDVDLIDFFRTAAPAGYIMAAIVSAIMLNFYTIRDLFIVVASVVIIALLPACKLLNNLSEADCKVQPK